MLETLKKIYFLLLGKICGTHPRVYPWHFQWLATRDLHKILKKELPKLSGDVLDIGCGDKPYKIWLKNAQKHIGIDIYDGAFVDYVIQPDEKWELQDNSFDAVISTQVLEHTENISHLLDEAFRVLKPKGVLIISAPFLYHEHGTPYDFWRFTKFGLEKLIKERGKIISVREFGRIGSTLSTLFLCWIMSFHTVKIFFPFLIPLFLVVNLIGLIWDKIDFSHSYYSGVVIVAEKD
ncbi:MAG: class I SAM-dependent methyltransferase [Alphaproteobacteria bacterium]